MTPLAVWVRCLLPLQHACMFPCCCKQPSLFWDDSHVFDGKHMCKWVPDGWIRISQHGRVPHYQEAWRSSRSTQTSTISLMVTVLAVKKVFCGVGEVDVHIFTACDMLGSGCTRAYYCWCSDILLPLVVFEALLLVVVACLNHLYLPAIRC